MGTGLKRAAAPIVAAMVMAGSFVAAPATAQADSNCDYLYLCIWDGFNYNGNKLAFKACGFVNIGNMGWSDRLRSFKNNQSQHALSVFSNFNPVFPRWETLDSSRAPESIPVVNFPLRTTDGIHVC